MTLSSDPLSEPLGGLPRDEWLARIEDIADDDGHFEPVGDRHSSVFIDRSPSVLLVTFEELDQVRLANRNGHPIGFQLAIDKGWSNLSILAHGDTWFRDESLYRYFDRLIDDGLFEDFDRVVFYGSEMGAYGAAAFSVCSPGATVIAVQPVATLAPSVANWDTRYLDKRRLDFSSRFGFAPRMTEAADKTYLIYDPQEPIDAMHAALFQGDGVVHLRCPNLGGRIEAEIDHMGILHPMLELTGNGDFDAQAFFALYRHRREHAVYLRRLLDRLEKEDRPYLAALLCKNAVQRLQRRRFHDGLATARVKLAERGILLDGPVLAPATE